MSTTIHLPLILPYMTSPQLTPYSMRKAKIFSSMFSNKTRIATLAAFILCNAGSPIKAIRQVKEIKHPNWKEGRKDVNLSLQIVGRIVCRCYDILYKENLKDYIKKL